MLHVLWLCLGTCSIVFSLSEICFLSHRPCSWDLLRSPYRPLSIPHPLSAACVLPLSYAFRLIVICHKLHPFGVWPPFFVSSSTVYSPTVTVGHQHWLTGVQLCYFVVLCFVSVHFLPIPSQEIPVSCWVHDGLLWKYYILSCAVIIMTCTYSRALISINAANTNALSFTFAVNHQ